MLRSVSSLIKGNPEVANDDEFRGQSNPASATTQEANASEPEIRTSAAHVVALESLSGEPSLEESRQASREGEQSSVSQGNSEWVAVDFAGQGAVRDVVHESHVDAVGPSERLNDDNDDVMRTNAVSTSHFQDANAVHTSSATDVCTGQQQHDTTIIVHQPLEEECQIEKAQQLESSNVSVFQQSCRDAWKTPEAIVASTSNGMILRTLSAFSADSLAEYCRICQQPTDEPLMELGCHCRGELSKTHRTCIQQWFNNRGTNKCEVCQHVATNLPPPAAHSLQHFWTWRISRPYGRASQMSQGRGQFHPLWAALLILVAGLLFDVLISYYLGASALPVNIIIGVLVVLGLGTAARLVVECLRERSVRRSIRRLEMAADMDQLQSDNRLIGIH